MAAYHGTQIESDPQKSGSSAAPPKHTEFPSAVFCTVRKSESVKHGCYRGLLETFGGRDERFDPTWPDLSRSPYLLSDDFPFDVLCATSEANRRTSCKFLQYPRNVCGVWRDALIAEVSTKPTADHAYDLIRANSALISAAPRYWGSVFSTCSNCSRASAGCFAFS